MSRAKQAACAALVAVFLAAGADGATSTQTGGSGYSGTLSSNPMLRRQQLNVDPPQPTQGTVSVRYDANLVRLVDVQPGPGYAPLGGNAGSILVEIGDGFTNFEPLSSHLSSSGNCCGELGYVQLRFELTNITGTGRIPPAPGYQFMASDPGITGTQGVDTFALFFELLDSELPLDTVVEYQILGALNEEFKDSQNDGNPADFLTAIDDQTGQPFTRTQAIDPMTGQRVIQPARVAAALVPEPGAAGLLAAAAGGGLSARRRRRAAGAA